MIILIVVTYCDRCSALVSHGAGKLVLQRWSTSCFGCGLGSGGLSGESPTQLHAEACNGDTFGALLLVRGIIYSEVSFLLGLVEKSWFLFSGGSIPSWRHRRRDRTHPQIKLLVYFGGFARAPVSQCFGGLQAIFLSWW